MSENLLGTIVLHFEGNDSTNYSAQVEADELRNIDVTTGEEKTSFYPGDPYYFLVYHTSNVYIDRVLATVGDVHSLGSVSRTRSNQCLFVETNSEDTKPTLSYVPTGGFTLNWFTDIAPFNVGSGLELNDADLSLTISGGTVPCKVEISYGVNFRSYRYVPPTFNLSEGESVSVDIVVYLGDA